MSQSELVGNTNTTSPIKHSKYQIYKVFFTYNIPNPNEPEPEDVYNMLSEYCKKFEFQLEQGKNGNWHYQGWFSLKTKEYFNTIMNMFPKMHIEPMKDYFASIKYCSKKDDTYRDGPWNEKSTFIKVYEPREGWQTDLFIDLIQEPNPRTILWYIDSVGGSGKSTFAKYMKVKHNALVIRNGKTADIAYMYNNEPIVIMDISRSSEYRFNYEVLEQLKDGMLMNSKYESNFKCFNNPHVVVFSNWPPDKAKLSHDRWDIRVLS